MTGASPGPDATVGAAGTGPSSLAAAVAAAVAAHRTQKVPLQALWAAAVAHDRSLATAAHGRAELADALAEVAAAGAATLPADRSAYDRRSVPPLPQWIRRPPRPTAERQAAAERIWPSALRDAGRLANRPDELALLEVVTDFLRAGGVTRLPVPSRERSLELFGDEKRLDALVSSRLFSSGALSLDLLRCHPVPMPFASQWVPGADTGEVVLLVAENHHTYASLLRASREQAAAGGPARHVGYGGGGQFCSAVASVVLLEPAPTRIVYFGDLDVRGLQIPVAADQTARAAQLPPVQPATGLYALLLRLGRRVEHQQVLAGPAAAAAAWLGPLGDEAAGVLSAGCRMAQEAVGRDALDAHPDLLRQL